MLRGGEHSPLRIRGGKHALLQPILLASVLDQAFDAEVPAKVTADQKQK